MTPGSQVDYERMASQAMVMLRQGNYDSAIRIYDELLVRFPNYIDGWYNKGIALYRHMGRHQEGLAAFDRALQIDGEDIDIWHERGKLLLILHQNDAALQSFERVLTLRPNYRISIEGKAAAYYAMERYEDAATTCDQVLALYPPGHPNTMQALKTKAMCQNNLTKFKAAIQTANRALRITQKDDTIWETKGLALAGQGKFQEAIQCLEYAITLNPNNQSASDNLTQIRQTIEDHYAVESS